MKRVLAWLAIVGLIFLILDISYFHYRLDIAFGIYAAIIIYFLLTNKKA
jgi:hypothetical protein